MFYSYAVTRSLHIAADVQYVNTGLSFRVALGNLPPGNSTALALGASNSLWGAVSLPFDLSGIGMTG